MKELYLIRHAKSSWDNYLISDFDRPLNERGHADAPMMAKKMLELGAKPDQLVTSTALRAFTTCTYFAETFNMNDKIFKEPYVYESSVRTLTNIIQNLNDDWHCVFLFGHNPTVTMLASMFTDTPFDNMPTCSIAKIELNMEDWKTFEYNKGKLKNFWYPKMFK